ncbi:bifunctional phosphopantothenoylcysteine decarboxylase/phosphopantothenate--cysteine ligase CoaBC [Helicobacter sp. 11S02596-1]|uniref:bifunctional phosphopantothenoylcysteine decarboxylase/phosphopantothenate--cysteine ligase CoaBC n=1 Tax=Helicobacter sp. 11S02596-1 TaxID=1476194 RepID=UPI000BA6D5EA|nr:bifunctional phosphopantothenoylcysteine decarboxylase/phosphopantothenate--cysteine ligase CoaBC [Helicobacter sp. 11S02596-1]PAF43541.1 hypothetical protein BJI48_04600 [Helicobacter sp. 11S02596-1]
MQDFDVMGYGDILRGKNVLLLVTGSIAVYKALELASWLKKQGGNVRVVMSEEAKKFVTPLSFEAILHTRVLHAGSEDWVQPAGRDGGDSVADRVACDGGAGRIDGREGNSRKGGVCHDSVACQHIAYARWADIAILAPASANTLAKIATGVADGLVLCTLLACKAPKILAPAMNTAMFEAQATQRNLRLLADDGFVIIPPRVSLLACDSVGNGAMASIEEIVFGLWSQLHSEPFWQGKDVVITGGGSVERIDAVRYISNHSSGLQASFLALAFALLGANVRLIASAFPIKLPLCVQCVEVRDSASYLVAIERTCEELASKERVYLLMAAAISDYVPERQFDGKLKKDAIGAMWELRCRQNVDVLKSICAPNLFKIGFKAETDEANAIESAKKMLQSPVDGGKGCEAVCLNLIGAHNPFGSPNNAMVLLAKDKKGGMLTHRTGYKDKLSIGFEIATFIRNLC